MHSTWKNKLWVRSLGNTTIFLPSSTGHAIHSFIYLFTYFLGGLVLSSGLLYSSTLTNLTTCSGPWVLQPRSASPHPPVFEVKWPFFWAGLLWGHLRTLAPFRDVNTSEGIGDCLRGCWQLRHSNSSPPDIEMKWQPISTNSGGKPTPHPPPPPNLHQLQPLTVQWRPSAANNIIVPIWKSRLY